MNVGTVVTPRDGEAAHDDGCVAQQSDVGIAIELFGHRFVAVVFMIA